MKITMPSNSPLGPFSKLENGDTFIADSGLLYVKAAKYYGMANSVCLCGVDSTLSECDPDMEVEPVDIEIVVLRRVKDVPAHSPDTGESLDLQPAERHIADTDKLAAIKCADGGEMKSYTLIVVPCYLSCGEWRLNRIQGIFMKIRQARKGDPHSEEVYSSLDTLLLRAKLFCKPGLAVILRPNFNDLTSYTSSTDQEFSDLENTAGEVIGFREWRSFDGGPLEEICFPT